MKDRTVPIRSSWQLPSKQTHTIHMGIVLKLDLLQPSQRYAIERDNISLMLFF